MAPRKYLKHLVLLASLSLGGVAAFAPGARADDPEGADDQLIVVRGVGEVHVHPDSLRVNVGVEARATTLEQVREHVTRAMRQVIDAVRATGIANLTIDTRVVQVNPIYAPHRADQPPSIIGFAASNHVVVTVRGAPAAELGDRGSRVIDAAMTAGANSVGGLELFLADPSTAQDEALAAAVADAQHDAAVIAKAAGVSLCGLRSVEESSGSHLSPRSVTLEASVSTPVEVEDILVQSDVTARFAFE